MTSSKIWDSVDFTPQEIEAEWQYRYAEALGLGRNEQRARKEADQWKAQFTNQKPNEQNA